MDLTDELTFGRVPKFAFTTTLAPRSSAKGVISHAIQLVVRPRIAKRYINSRSLSRNVLIARSRRVRVWQRNKNRDTLLLFIFTRCHFFMEQEPFL